MTSTTEAVVAVVLAAGKGTRMRSSLPKVLHTVAGRPLLLWPMLAAQQAGVERCLVVLGQGRTLVEEELARQRQLHPELKAETCVQLEQLGTGDAVRCAVEQLAAFTGRVLILYGDCPLVRPETLGRLMMAAAVSSAPLTMLTSVLDEPDGYGRIVRADDGRVVAICEERDCSAAELQLREVNPGIYVIDADFLRAGLATLQPSRHSGELYLTDLVEAAASRGGVTDVPADMAELRGINDRYELALAEAAMQRRLVTELARGGVTVRDLASVHLDADVVVEPEAVLEGRVVLRGRTRIGSGARLDVGCVLQDTEVAAGAYLKPYTVATDSRIGAAAQVGPFAHLRPGSDIGEQAHLGNFVETKKTRLGRRSKANHLSYLGDAIVGDDVNIGAGTIVCNYDGFQKHTTHVDDGVFIGSDSQLIAPLRLGKGAYIATGTTVTKDVPPDGLAISRVPQTTKGEGYASRLKARLRMAADKLRRSGTG